MKRLLILVVLFSFSVTSCEKEEYPEYLYTGNIEVTTTRETYYGVPIEDHLIGIFDMSLIDRQSGNLDEREAIYAARFENQKIQFSNLNPDTYFIGIVGSRGRNIDRRIVQVRAGQTTTTDF